VYLSKVVLMHVILSDRRERRISFLENLSLLVHSTRFFASAALRLRMTWYIIFIVKRY